MLLKDLKKSYEANERGIRISYLGDSFKLTTKQEHKEKYNSSFLFISKTAKKVTIKYSFVFSSNKSKKSTLFVKKI